MTEDREPVVAEVWERIEDGKAPVTIGRVWEGNIGGHDDRYVRCEPLRGGRWWFTTLAEFVKRYRLRRGFSAVVAEAVTEDREAQ